MESTANGSWEGIFPVSIQERLRTGCGDGTIHPYVQTTSTCNHIIERIWVKLNQRVTYPVKRIIKSMDDSSINMDCDITKFCVSAVHCQICDVEIRRMISVWNNHPIPHCGIPNDLYTASSLWHSPSTSS